MGGQMLGLVIPMQSQDIFPDSKSELSLRQVAVDHFCIPCSGFPVSIALCLPYPLMPVADAVSMVFSDSGVLEDLTGELSGDLGVTTRGQSEMKPPLVRAHLIRPGRSPFLAFSQGFLQTTVLRTLNSRTSLSSLDQSFIVSSNQTGEEMGDCSAAKALALRGQHPPPTTDCFITRGS